MTTTAKTSRFQIGDRVKLNEAARTRNCFSVHFSTGITTGVVTAKLWGVRSSMVQFDGVGMSQCVADDWLDPEPPQPAPGFAGGKFNPKFLGNPLAT